MVEIDSVNSVIEPKLPTKIIYGDLRLQLIHNHSREYHVGQDSAEILVEGRAGPRRTFASTSKTTVAWTRPAGALVGMSKAASGPSSIAQQPGT